MKSCSSKSLLFVTTLVTLSTLSIFSACGKKKSDLESASASIRAVDVPSISDEEKKKKLDKEGRELVAYLYTKSSSKYGTMTVMTSRGKDVLTANHVDQFAVAGGAFAYTTIDPTTAEKTFYVFDRDGNEFFRLHDITIKNKVDQFKVTNSFVALYKNNTHKLTVYNLEGQVLVNNEDAEADFNISDTLIAYQTRAHQLRVKDISGNLETVI